MRLMRSSLPAITVFSLSGELDLLCGLQDATVHCGLSTYSLSEKTSLDLEMRRV